MVVDQLRAQLSDEELDRLFQAFADTTRRDIVRRVTVGEYSVSGLAALYAMSFAAVQKHVAVLERASLVSKEKRGREQIVRANHDGLQRARRLLDEYEVIWRQRADRIADLLAETATTEPDKTQTGTGQTKNTQSNKTEGTTEG
ncbi:transcriptional regulator, ArsR family [Arthrobacter sp. ov407]|uniref:ArsR/SmtB family transcription factor n=1 Tax=Arthrobacter sp. ov407 TaxID=1761748 RepID=UPI00088CB686|nr:metalloregulator ArsR/SmtB family transcription factor [Arthrobacter sp. ov407]SDL99551.1 transcriptional regulator, ArsR family [Arthrobacter sp. ov407]